MCKTKTMRSAAVHRLYWINSKHLLRYLLHTSANPRHVIVIDLNWTQFLLMLHEDCVNFSSFQWSIYRFVSIMSKNTKLRNLSSGRTEMQMSTRWVVGDDRALSLDVPCHMSLPEDEGMWAAAGNVPRIRYLTSPTLVGRLLKCETTDDSACVPKLVLCWGLFRWDDWLNIC